MITSVNATAAAYAGGMKTVAAGGTAAGNKAALQAALNSGRCVHIPYGSYYIEPGLLKQAHSQVVFGQGVRQTILVVQGSGDLFNNNDKYYTGISYMGITGDPNATHGAAYRYNGSAAICKGGICSNLLISGYWDGIIISAANTTIIEKVEMVAMRGNFGIYAYAETEARRTDVITIRDCIYTPIPSIRTTRGTALAVDGFVHSIGIESYRTVKPYMGMYIANSYGLPPEWAPSFIEANIFEVDFPYLSGARFHAGNRIKFTNSYFHGAETSTNFYYDTPVKDVSIFQTTITGAYENGLTFDGHMLQVIGSTFEWNGQQAPATHSNILLGNNAQWINVIGGVGDASTVAYGIYRWNPATWVQHSCADMIGPRNF